MIDREGNNNKEDCISLIDNWHEYIIVMNEE